MIRARLRTITALRKSSTKNPFNRSFFWTTDYTSKICITRKIHCTLNSCFRKNWVLKYFKANKKIKHHEAFEVGSFPFSWYRKKPKGKKGQPTDLTNTVKQNQVSWLLVYSHTQCGISKTGIAPLLVGANWIPPSKGTVLIFKCLPEPRGLMWGCC